MSVTKEQRQAAETQALKDYEAVVGKTIETNCVIGYNDRDDSVEVYFDPPILVRVDPTNRDSVLHWNDNWLDPYWDVTPVQEHEELKGIRSFWTDGTSIDASTL